MDYYMNSETLARHTEQSIAVAKVRNRTRQQLTSDKLNMDASLYKDPVSAYANCSPISFKDQLRVYTTKGGALDQEARLLGSQLIKSKAKPTIMLLSNEKAGRYSNKKNKTPSAKKPFKSAKKQNSVPQGWLRDDICSSGSSRRNADFQAHIRMHNQTTDY